MRTEPDLSHLMRDPDRSKELLFYGFCGHSHPLDERIAPEFSKPLGQGARLAELDPALEKTPVDLPPGIDRLVCNRLNAPDRATEMRYFSDLTWDDDAVETLPDFWQPAGKSLHCSGRARDVLEHSAPNSIQYVEISATGRVRGTIPKSGYFGVIPRYSFNLNDWTSEEKDNRQVPRSNTDFAGYPRTIYYNYLYHNSEALAHLRAMPCFAFRFDLSALHLSPATFQMLKSANLTGLTEVSGNRVSYYNEEFVGHVWDRHSDSC